MFIINNLTVKYNKKVVLNDLSLKLDMFSINGIIGYNGAGKTTLLNAIYGLIETPRSCFILNNKRLERSDIAYLESSNYFYSNITGRDYLKLFHRKNNSFNIELWSSIFNLPLDKFIETYSTGMKKKLALLGVLSMDKQIIILDEPFNGLDIESVMALQIICKKLIERKKTIIITSHIIESLTTICDSISVLKDGVIESTIYPSEFDILTENITEEMNAKYRMLIDEAMK